MLFLCETHGNELEVDLLSVMLRWPIRELLSFIRKLNTYFIQESDKDRDYLSKISGGFVDLFASPNFQVYLIG